MNRLEQGSKTEQKNIILNADTSVIPCAGENELFKISLAPYEDHGRPAFLASTIKSRNALVNAANELSRDESLRLTKGAGKILEDLLDGGKIRSETVLTSKFKSKPNIHVVVFGDPFNSSSLRLYCHQGEYRGARVLFQDARTKTGNADKVEKTFSQDGGYTSPKNWGSRKGRS